MKNEYDQIKKPYDQFTAMFGKDFAGKMAIWSKQDMQTAFFSSDELAEAEKYALKKAETCDVYVGVALVRDDIASGRGKAEDVVALPGFWLDVDLGSTGHKGTQYPPDQKNAWAIVKMFPVKPSLVVHSGYGLHVYWLFEHLLVLDTPERREKAAALSKKFQKKMQDLFAAQGYKIDNTSDLPRVLRVVGTINHKAGQRKKVRAIYPKQKEEHK